jgi:MoaA/NifB/PqqE/SkfB family radical SAM enzyme
MRTGFAENYQNPKSSEKFRITRSIDHTTQLKPMSECIGPKGEYKPGVAKSLKMSITDDCNYGCLFCGRDKWAESRVVDPNFVIDIGRQALEMGITKFGVFFDGESTLHPDILVKCIRGLKEIGMPYVFLTTNGAALTEKNARAILEAGINSIKFSFNANFEQFPELTGCGVGVLRKALANLKKLREIRDSGNFDCGIYASSIVFNKDQPKKMYPFLQEYVYPHVDEHYWLDEYSMGGEDAVENMQGIGEPIRGNSGRHGEVRPAMPCWAVFNALHVTLDGKLYSCCFPTNQDGHIMADLKKSFPRWRR